MGNNLTHSFILNKNSIAWWGFWLIIPFCSFTSHTYLPLPPTLVLFMMGCIILLPLFTDRIYHPEKLILPCLLIVYIFLSQTLMGAPLKHYMGVILAISYFIITISLGPHLSTEKRNQLVEIFIFLSILLFIVECTWRYTHPDIRYPEFSRTDDISWIYRYKMKGLIYVDSNGVAIHLIILLFFLLYRESESLGTYTWYKIILGCLLILTLSRASWIGAGAGWLYFKFLHKKQPLPFAINLVSILFLVLIIYVFVFSKLVGDDYSFNSKFEVTTSVVNYLRDASLRDLVFGMGFSNSLHVLHIYAHNFFFVFLVESGIIGLLLMMALFVQFTTMTNAKALIILIPFIITSLSSTITFTPYLYVIMALIYLDHLNMKIRHEI